MLESVILSYQLDRSFMVGFIFGLVLVWFVCCGFCFCFCLFTVWEGIQPNSLILLVPNHIRINFVYFHGVILTLMHFFIVYVVKALKRVLETYYERELSFF